MDARVQIFIRGIVQGVGFRPFIYRLAEHLALKGFIRNNLSGVVIEAEGKKEILNEFLTRIKVDKPQLASIHGMEFSFLDTAGYSKFTVLDSVNGGETEALILPDIALCSDCLEELFNKNNRRYLYPFINCTNCGPRFTIIESLPYDRLNTSMKSFNMCKCCREEYENPADRRFHAQPIACAECGPSIKLLDRSGRVIISGESVISEAVDKLRAGKIVALKGLGGYQLLADARNDHAVKLLRQRKFRESKPLAVMVTYLSMASELCETDEFEKSLLSSPESPVVLLKRKKENNVSALTAPGNPYLGIMLPYTPLHHLITREFSAPLIATSGNISEEPMCITEYEALKRLSVIADYFLVHDRGIVRAVDDSVVRVVKGREMMIRRARGYAPLPVRVEHSSRGNIIALGGQLKNTISIAKGDNIFVSQHLGDLENYETELYMKSTINDLSKIYDAEADHIVHDLHPGYTSTKIALGLNELRTAVQHHHAHAAACYYENQVEGDCLAVCWDGTGYGSDGTIWGGEFFLFNGIEFRHAARLKQFGIPGGDKAVRDVRRSAAGILYSIYGERAIRKIQRFNLPEINNEFEAFISLLQKNLNCFVTSSAGRLIDAVSWLLDISTSSKFEGESAMKLEFSIEPGITDFYPYDIIPGEVPEINWHPLILKLLSDIRDKISKGIISARFHNTLVQIIFTIALMTGRKKVLLSGGCFQNMYLLNGVIDKFNSAGITPYWHQRIPSNDGGISFGQAALVSAILSKKGETECV
jgi:hydrogenase maturation protein HypF